MCTIPKEGVKTEWSTQISTFVLTFELHSFSMPQQLRCPSQKCTNAKIAVIKAWHITHSIYIFGKSKSGRKWTIGISRVFKIKKRVKNLRDISMSFRDSSNSLATIIAGHLKIATTVKNRRLNDNWAIAWVSFLQSATLLVIVSFLKFGWTKIEQFSWNAIALKMSKYLWWFLATTWFAAVICNELLARRRLFGQKNVSFWNYL